MKQSNCQIAGCRNFGKYCRLHLGYTVPVVKEVAKVSETQKDILKQYKPIRAKFLEAHPNCQAKLEGCKGKANEVHHMAGKASKELYLDSKLFLAVCNNCHQIITKNSAWAVKQGFSVSRLKKI